MRFEKKNGFVKTARAVAPFLVFGIVGAGLAFSTGLGTPSSFGWDAVAAACPLGILESLAGGWGWIPRVAVEAAIVVLGAFFLGRSFCAWICPVSRISELLKGKDRARAEDDERKRSSKAALERWRRGERPARRRLDARHAVAAGAVFSSFLFGFPVFCLVCPVGLTFATFVLAWRTVQYGELSWGLVVFPAIIVVELLAMKRWCVKICPIGGLLSLLASKRGAFRVVADESSCLRTTKGAPCTACGSACPQSIDPFADLGDASNLECTRCHRCVEACPENAVSMRVLPPADEN